MSKEAVEEYEPGPGTPNTLEGFRLWCVFRDRHEQERRRQRDAAAAEARRA